MKKIIALLLAVLMLSVTACQLTPAEPGTSEPTESAPDLSGQTDPEPPESGTQAGEPEESASEPEESATEPAESAAGTETGSGEPAEDPQPADLSAFKFAFADYIEQSMGDRISSYMVSPVSFQYALGMLLAGADGETKAQLLQALGMEEKAFEREIREFGRFVESFNQKKETQRETYSQLSPEEKMWAKDPSGSLRVADSVWKREDLPEFLEEYAERLALYDAERFSFSGGDIIRRANDWVHEKTSGMIERILPDDYDVKDLVVLLMNALYYKNGWEDPFSDAPETEFTTVNGETVRKEFMASTQHYRYYRDDETELVVVPMNDSVFITFVLGSTEDLERKIQAGTFQKVRVCIPKFEIESSFTGGELVAFLNSRGASDVFDPDRANLGKMIDLSAADFNLYVADILQKTKIKLDETGVEAAAVTAILVNKTTSVANPEPVIQFTADRPFHFLIHCCEVPTCGNTTDGELQNPRFVLFEGLLAE